MKNKNWIRLAAVVLALLMCLGAFSACKKAEETPASEEATPSESQAAEISTTPLVFGTATLSEKFSPFFADSGYDVDLVAQTQVNLLTTDRVGGIVYNAIEGETIPYNGTDYVYKGIADLKVEYDKDADQTVYTWTIRDDVKFSDGEVMDADDVIFSYYVYFDPNYTGATMVSSVPIIGLQNYRTQTSDEVFERYGVMFDDIYAAGRDHEWSSGDSWTQEQQTSFWSIIETEWKADVQAIVDVCINDYIGYAADLFPGFTAEEITSTPGLQVAYGMAAWNYGTLENGVLTAPSGATFDLANGVYPTIDDYYAECYAAYGGDPEAYWSVEAPDEDSVIDAAKASFISTEGPKDPSLGGSGIPNVTGIKKVSDTVVTITVQGYDASAIYRLGVQVAPLHYYGDVSKYDYENNKFGFDFGDLSGVQSKTTQPMGAGPYRFIKYENKVAYLEANENYYKGMPKTYYLQFKETQDDDVISGVTTGTIDIGNPSFSTDVVDEICSNNSNGELSGDKIETNTVDNLGYGFIGLNAATMNVGGVADSDASKSLRKGFATLIAAYRDLTVDSYYGERAEVINYPISNTSWAAPQKTDEDYRVAYSVAADGSEIYTSDMTDDQKYEAALQATVNYLIAAGYTFDEASGKFTAAPDGAKLEYEVIIPGEGNHDHPSFTLVTKVQEALATIGINLIITDPTDSNVLWDKLDAGTQEIWCMAWGATLDPDMYQTYHSSNIPGLPGASGSNYYHIADADLDQLMMDARTSEDQGYRKQVYKQCLDIILDWAVEIPIYQRQNCIVFSSERINLDTVTPDITTYWYWYYDIELLEMKDAA